jgi:hypothetical protein
MGVAPSKLTPHLAAKICAAANKSARAQPAFASKSESETAFIYSGIHLLKIAAVSPTVSTCDPTSIYAGAMTHMNKTFYMAASGCGFAAAFILCNCFAPTWLSDLKAQADEETPTEILAARVRDQGYACNKAQASKEELAQSAPNETVWILNCESGSYRVTLVPDLAAKIERLNK